MSHERKKIKFVANDLFYGGMICFPPFRSSFFFHFFPRRGSTYHKCFEQQKRLSVVTFTPAVNFFSPSLFHTGALPSGVSCSSSSSCRCTYQQHDFFFALLLPFLFSSLISLLFPPFSVFPPRSSFLSSQVCRRRRRARTCTGFRDC